MLKVLNCEFLLIIVKAISVDKPVLEIARKISFSSFPAISFPVVDKKTGVKYPNESSQ